MCNVVLHCHCLTVNQPDICAVISEVTCRVNYLFINVVTLQTLLRKDVIADA